MKKIFTLILVLFSVVITYGQVLNQKSMLNSTIPSDNVYSIDFDDNGNVYVGTQMGVYVYNRTNGTTASYNTASGLATNDVRFVKYVNGNIIAGRINGLSIFNGSAWTNHTTNSTGGKYVMAYLPATNNVNGIDYAGGTMGIASNDGSGNYMVGTSTSPVAYNSILLDTTRRGSSTDWFDHVWYATGGTQAIVDWDIKNDIKTSYSVLGNPSNLSSNSNFTKFVFTSSGYVRIFDVATKTQTFIPGITTATFATYDKNGNIWFAYGTGGGVVKVQKYDGTNFSHGVVVSTAVKDIKISDDGNLFLATPTGIYEYDFDTTPILNIDETTETLSTIEVDNATYQWYYSSTAPSTGGSNFKIASDDFTAIAGANSYSFQPTDAGYYKVEITQSTGTTESLAFKFGEVTTTGISNAVIKDSDMNVYPNPNVGTFSVSTPFDVVEVIVTNQVGQSEKASFNGTEVTTSIKGLVVVNIKTNKGVAIKKMIIQ